MSSKTKTIKVPVQATITKYGRGSVAVRAVGLEVRGRTEKEVVASLSERLDVAFAGRPVDVLRVALAGTDVHVLVSRLGAIEMRMYDASDGPTSRGPLVDMQFDPADAPSVSMFRAFDRTSATLLEVRRGTSALAIAADDSAALLRAVADAASVNTAGEHVDVAQRITLELARLRRRAEDAERRASLLEAAEPGEAASPEAAAFARLLGLSPTDPKVRAYALAVLDESAGERWAHTLSDLCDGPKGLLAAVDEACQAEPEPEVEEFEHQFKTWQALEEDVVEMSWDMQGPIDREIAKQIDQDDLGGAAGKALEARIAAAVAEATESETT